MKQVIFDMTGISPYSQSQRISTPKLGKETAADHENRCWRDRLHRDEAGCVVIPPMAIKNALSDMARFLSMPVPGKGKSTYTKFIEAGVLCLEHFPIVDKAGRPIKAASVKGEWLFVPASGKRGDGKRVDKCFPVIEAGWSATAKIVVLDDMITKDVLAEHLRRMGQFIGIGRFRPRNNGFYGRFEVSNIRWSELDVAEAA